MKNCIKPLKNIENRQTCRKFVEILPKLPKTINKKQTTQNLQNRQNCPKSVKKHSGMSKNLKKTVKYVEKL